MQELLTRYEALPEYIKDWPLVKIREFREKKVTTTDDEAPSSKVLTDFDNKLKKCEDKLKEANVWLPKLIEKRDYVHSILSHPQYKEGKMSAGFKSSLKAVQTRLAKFEWSAEDDTILIKGKPFGVEVKGINTDHLKKTWEKSLPKPAMMDAKAFDAFMSKANACIEQFRPIFLKNGCGEKLEAWNTLEATLRQKLKEDDTVVDVLELKDIYEELDKHIPKSSAKKKKDWTNVRSEYQKRAKAPQFKADKKAMQKYEHLDDLFQEAYEERNVAKMEKYFAKIDALLPKKGTFKESVCETTFVTKDEIKGTTYHSSDNDDEEEAEFSDEEEEEEEEEEESSYSVERLPKSKKRGRAHEEPIVTTLSQVLDVFSGTNKHIGEQEPREKSQAQIFS